MCYFKSDFDVAAEHSVRSALQIEGSHIRIKEAPSAARFLLVYAWSGCYNISTDMALKSSMDDNTHFLF